MRYIVLTVFLFCFIGSNSQVVQDDFEGGGTISTWFGDDCSINTAASNPYSQGINTSATVLAYDDTGGQFANVRFDVNTNFDLATNNTFSLKIYVPSNGITGSQPNQVSLKLQNGTLAQPWITQTEIIKSIELDQWQEVTFNFESDSYINLDAGSPPPIQRTDLNRVVIQINGENNNDQVLAYVDDIDYFNTEPVDVEDPVYDTLVWSDEFDGTGPIDSSKWFHQTQIPAGGNWFNGELQHYTDRTDNAFLSGGFLNIVAKKETYSDQGYTKDYTSARLNSKFAFTHGRVEVRAKLPIGVGTWPAIWTLGKNINEAGAYWETQGYGTTTWPACGEIDIMEHWGNNQNFVQSATHTPSSFGNTINKGGQTISTVSSDFHVYTLVWSPERMVFSVDGVEHYVYNPEFKNASTWPFEADQYLLLNIAIEPSVTPSFTESAMQVDYIRVYQESQLSVPETSNGLDFTFSPNPVKDQLQLSFSSLISSSVELQVYDLNGRSVLTKVVAPINGTATIKMSSLTPGFYICEVSSREGLVERFKFIKE